MCSTKGSNNNNCSKSSKAYHLPLNSIPIPDESFSRSQMDDSGAAAAFELLASSVATSQRGLKRTRSKTSLPLISSNSTAEDQNFSSKDNLSITNELADTNVSLYT